MVQRGRSALPPTPPIRGSSDGSRAGGSGGYRRGGRGAPPGRGRMEGAARRNRGAPPRARPSLSAGDALPEAAAALLGERPPGGRGPAPGNPAQPGPRPERAPSAPASPGPSTCAGGGPEGREAPRVPAGTQLRGNPSTPSFKSRLPLHRQVRGAAFWLWHQNRKRVCRDPGHLPWGVSGHPGVMGGGGLPRLPAQGGSGTLSAPGSSRRWRVKEGGCP